MPATADQSGTGAQSQSAFQFNTPWNVDLASHPKGTALSNPNVFVSPTVMIGVGSDTADKSLSFRALEFFAQQGQNASPELIAAVTGESAWYKSPIILLAGFAVIMVLMVKGSRLKK